VLVILGDSGFESDVHVRKRLAWRRGFANRDVLSLRMGRRLQVFGDEGGHTGFAQAMSDPCLQAADYLTWAVQRKYERDDSRSYDLIEPLIRSEFEPFSTGDTQY
jgi:hypothetical protein